MAGRNRWQTAESISKVFAAVVIPIVLAGGTIWANQAIERSKIKDELLKQAIEVVFLSKDEKISGDSKSFESRRAHRSHWLEIYNSLADVKLSNDFIALMMEQDTIAAERPLYWTGNLPERMTRTGVVPPAATAEDSETGHGWVAVGHLDSRLYSDSNFDVNASTIRRDATIKPGEIIRARWTVTLRSNTRNLEDRQGYSGSSLGLLWGGECTKVIDSQADGRGQTWAFIEIVPCPDGAGSDRERRGPGVASLTR
jgi:hypothetical protein